MEKRESKLWIIEFHIRLVGDTGCAIVQADNASQAEQVLKSSGTYNGQPTLYDIIRIEQVPTKRDSLLVEEPMLLAEQINNKKDAQQ